MAQPSRPFRPSPRPLADLIDSCLGEALAKQGFAGSDIVLNWPDIVGEPLARRSRPVRIVWPRKATGMGRNPAPQEPATLHVRVESAFALELQHLAPVVVERVNAYFGWACIGRLRLEQGPVPRPKPAGAKPAPSPAVIAAAEKAAAGIEDEGLRGALVRLGAAVMERERREPRTKS
ncbi:DUF721 domain-containing protein [Terrarubrum flagellatum]|uniref:DUF721 domain-containing protein n=1 Tax=Terrirubrum flagellatum TaxID=2895980 RepID=UPI0031450A29